MGHMAVCDSMPSLTTEESLSKPAIDPCHIKIENKEPVETEEVLDVLTAIFH